MTPPEGSGDTVTFHEKIIENMSIKFFKALYSDVSIYGAINGMTGAQAKDNEIYGVNGTFFQMSSKSIYGIAVNDGLAVNVKTNLGFGGINNHSDLDSFLCATKIEIGGVYVRLANTNNFPFNIDLNIVDIQNVRWAIGGHDLLVSATFSNETDFVNNLSAGAKIYGPTKKTQRTFIGSNGINVYLCTSHNKCTMYEEHKILKSLGCSIGINVDGGGSTFISHKDGSTQSESRGVPTIVRVLY